MFCYYCPTLFQLLTTVSVVKIHRYCKQDAGLGCSCPSWEKNVSERKFPESAPQCQYSCLHRSSDAGHIHKIEREFGRQCFWCFLFFQCVLFLFLTFLEVSKSVWFQQWIIGLTCMTSWHIFITLYSITCGMKMLLLQWTYLILKRIAKSSTNKLSLQSVSLKNLKIKPMMK